MGGCGEALAEKSKDGWCSFDIMALRILIDTLKQQYRYAEIQALPFSIDSWSAHILIPFFSSLYSEKATSQEQYLIKSIESHARFYKR